MSVSGVIVRQDTLNSKLILEGDLSQRDLDKINVAIEKYSEDIHNFIQVKEDRDLVQIDVEILELSKTLMDKIGVNWSDSITFTDANPAAIVGDKFSQIMRLVDFTRTSIQVQVNMWEKEGKAKVLARPKLVCLSGKEASFLVGGEVPIISVDNGEAEVEYKEYGIKLDVSPSIEGDSVLLGMRSEVSDIDLTNSVNVAVTTEDIGTTQYSIPAFTKRITETQLFLKENQSIFIAGLLKDRVSKDELEKVPGLGDIPILGMLFKSKDYQGDQTELVISLTPRIIRKSKKAYTGDYIVKEKSQPYHYKTVNKSAAITEYVSGVQRVVNQSMSYPAMARDTGWKGALKLELNIASNGNLLESRIVDSSGYNVFDEHALAITKNLAPYPQFPLSMVEEMNIWVEIPIIFE